MGDIRLSRSRRCRIARSSHLLSRFRPGEIKKFEQGFQLFGATPRAVGILRLRDLRNLDERQLHEQALVAALSVAQVALVHQFQSLVEELCRARLSLRAVLGALLLAHLEQLQRLLVLSHEHVAHVRSQSVDEVAREVIQGKWGNGAERKKRLTEAGYDYNEVQKRVNALMK